MITNNPFSALAEIVPEIAMQGFVIAMATLTLVGVLVDILHKKNVKYFFENAKKAKRNAKVELTTPASETAAFAASSSDFFFFRLKAFFNAAAIKAANAKPPKPLNIQAILSKPSTILFSISNLCDGGDTFNIGAVFSLNSLVVNC